MEWQPIATYDSMEFRSRPKHAAFYFEAVKSLRGGGVTLDPTIELTRCYGSRICTHWVPLPEPPK